MNPEPLARSINASWHYDRWILGLIPDAEYCAWVHANVFPQPVKFWEPLRVGAFAVMG